MIELSNGHKLEFLAPSGTLAFDGRGWPWEWPLRWVKLINPHLFTIVVKTLMPEKWAGNFRRYKPFDVLKFVTTAGKQINPILAITRPELIGGIVNAIGLTGPGIDSWIERDHPTIVKHGYKVIVSITGPNGGEGCVEMARKINGLENVVGIEFNASCPNTDPTLLNDPETVVKTCRAIWEATSIPFLVKLSFVQPYLGIAKELEKYAEAISINTVPWKIVFGDKVSPLAKYGGGGVSGPVSQPYNWKIVLDLARYASIPVIGAGAWEYDDLGRLKFIGAKAFQLGTLHLPYPCRPKKYIEKWKKEGGK